MDGRCLAGKGEDVNGLGLVPRGIVDRRMRKGLFPYKPM